MRESLSTDELPLNRFTTSATTSSVPVQELPQTPSCEPILWGPSRALKRTQG